jgi:hypothetical protein
MGRAVVWLVVVVAAVAAVALALRLWRSRTTAEGTWRTQDYLTALGLVVSLLGIALPLLVARNDDGESPEVRRYREDVRAACLGIQPTTNPLVEAMTPGGDVDRARLEQGFRNQLTGAQGVLAVLWARTPPPELANDASEARTAGDALFAATSEKLDRMASELPETIPFADLAGYLGGMDAELRPVSSRFEGTMSHLAGEDCRAAPASQTT